MADLSQEETSDAILGIEAKLRELFASWINSIYRCGEQVWILETSMSKTEHALNKYITVFSRILQTPLLYCFSLCCCVNSLILQNLLKEHKLFSHYSNWVVFTLNCRIKLLKTLNYYCKAECFTLKYWSVSVNGCALIIPLLVNFKIKFIYLGK